jgi:hypothetical protein
MKLKDIIAISPGFHRSVNVKYDLPNESKVSGYIPTEKSEAVMKHVLSALQRTSNEGAALLIGSYGTGKSHLATFLGSLAGKQVSPMNFDPVRKKIRDDGVKQLLEKELDEKSPYLVVPIVGDAGMDLEQVLLTALKKSLEQYGLDCPIRCSYSSAIRFLDTWSASYPSTYMALDDLLAANDTDIKSSEPIRNVDELRKRLANCDLEALRLFADVYPTLTAGATFNFYEGNVADVYHDVCTELVNHRYRGIFLVLDELNKIMDTPHRGHDTLKPLQDLAEMASRSGEDFGFYLLLVSHRTIEQYATKAGSILADEWRKIEGRFEVFDVSNRPWETYDLISRVLLKKEPDFYKIVASHCPSITEVGQHRRLADLFEGIAPEFISEAVVKGCFPLHPITVFALPRVSMKLAQNERTLFTFLAGKDDSPLSSALDKELPDVEYILPWQLFDYFENQIRRSQDEHIKSIWTKVTNALESLPYDCEIESRFLKTIGIYQVIGNSANLPCTCEMIEYGLGSEEYSNALASLQKLRIIYIRQSTQTVEIVEPSEIDIEQEIANWIAQKPLNASVYSRISTFGLNHYVIPHRFNHEKKMTRFLTPVYVGIDNYHEVVNGDTLSPALGSFDGIICYMFPENHNELLELKKIALGCTDPSSLFVVPTEPVSVKNVVLRLLAIDALKESLKGMGVDARAANLVDLVREDAWEELKKQLDFLTTPSEYLLYYWNGQRITVASEGHLQDQAYAMMVELYKKPPIINNELINKHQPTTTSRRARNQVIDAVLLGYPDLRERLRSFQEEFMFDTLFVQPGLFDEETGSLANGTDQVKPVLQNIEEYLLDSKSNTKNLESLVSGLGRRPFGVRKGIMPVFLAVCIAKYHQHITIRNSAGLDCRIDASLLDSIVERPDEYAIILDDWNESREKLFAGLSELFGLDLSNHRALQSNRFGRLAEEMFRWFSGLPRFARETRTVNSNAQVLRSAARLANRNPKQVLFQDLPDGLGIDDLEGNVERLLNELQSAKQELDLALDRLREKAALELRDRFSIYGSTRESLTSLARNMADKLPVGELVQDLKWANLLEYITTFEGYDDSEFAYGLANMVTGIRMEDWVDTSWVVFTDTINEALVWSQDTRTSSAPKPKSELVYTDSTNTVNIPLYEFTETELGKLLQSHLETAIDDFGDAVTLVEKRQIIVNLLLKHI